MSTCPYCGEQVNALKNHVRLSSGGGHGPSGEYPDDFEGGAGSGDGGDAQAVAGSSDGGRSREDESSSAVNGSTEPVSTDTSANPAGDAGGGDVEIAQPPPVQLPPEPTTTTDTTEGADASTSVGGTPDTPPNEIPDDVVCPDCGSELVDFRGAETYAVDDTKIPVPNDFYCSNRACAQGFNWDAESAASGGEAGGVLRGLVLGGLAVGAAAVVGLAGRRDDGEAVEGWP